MRRTWLRYRSYLLSFWLENVGFRKLLSFSLHVSKTMRWNFIGDIWNDKVTVHTWLFVIFGVLKLNIMISLTIFIVGNQILIWKSFDATVCWLLQKLDFFDNFLISHIKNAFVKKLVTFLGALFSQFEFFECFLVASPLIFGNLVGTFEFLNCILENNVVPLECLCMFVHIFDFFLRCLQIGPLNFVVFFKTVNLGGKFDWFVAQPPNWLFQHANFLLLLHVLVIFARPLFHFNQFSLHLQHVFFVTNHEISFVFLYYRRV